MTHKAGIWWPPLVVQKPQTGCAESGPYMAAQRHPTSRALAMHCSTCRATKQGCASIDAWPIWHGQSIWCTIWSHACTPPCSIPCTAPASHMMQLGTTCEFSVYTHIYMPHISVLGLDESTAFRLTLKVQTCQTLRLLDPWHLNPPKMGTPRPTYQTKRHTTPCLPCALLPQCFVTD